jgi:hypothetical protein
MEPRRPDNIPGYNHPSDNTSYSKNGMYKTFTEGQKPKKKEKFGVVSSGSQYASAASPSIDDDNCPVCNTPYTSVCNCVYSDKKCKNGHVWYISRTDGQPTVGNPHKK